jgi:hypothetical protein
MKAYVTIDGERFVVEVEYEPKVEGYVYVVKIRRGLFTRGEVIARDVTWTPWDALAQGLYTIALKLRDRVLG